MKISVHDLEGKVKETMELPKFFSEKSIRIDLIKKAYDAEKSKERQAYGSDPTAGMKTSAHYHGRRAIRNSMMNRELGRIRRIHNQGYLNFRARVVSQAVKGRKAHPPKAEKNWEKKINKKERSKAILSAIIASIHKDMLVKRGHKIEKIKNIPLIIEDQIESMQKLSDLNIVLKNLGLDEELRRTNEKKVRSGRGKTRGRKYKKKIGPLIIVNKDKGISKAGRNIPGLDIVELNNININMLAPGTQPGRLCIWSKSAIKSSEKLFE